MPRTSSARQLEPADMPPFLERVTDKVLALVVVNPALVRLLEWQIDESLERASRSDGCSR